MKKDFWNSLVLDLIFFGFISIREFKSTKGSARFVIFMNIWTLSVLSFCIYFIYFLPNPQDYNIAGIVLVVFVLSFLSFLYSLETFKLDDMIYLNDLNLKVGDKISFEIEDKIKEGEIITMFTEHFKLKNNDGVIEIIYWSCFLDKITFLIWLDDKGEYKKCLQN